MATKFLRAFFPAVIVAAALSAGVSTNADAAFIAYICDDQLCTGGGDTIVTDQGAGDNFPGSAVVGQINTGALNVGGFTIATNIAQTSPLIGSAASPILNLTFSAVTNDNLSHTIYLYTSATGFTGQGTFAFSLGGAQPGNGDTIVGRAYGGNSNTNLNMSNLLATLGPTSTSPFNLATSGAFAPTVNPYGLTIGVAITRSSAGTSGGGLEFSVSPAAVPEPDALSLLGLGMVAVLAASRARRKTPASA